MARRIPLKKLTQEDFDRLFARQEDGLCLHFKSCDLNGLDLSAKKLASVVFEDCNLNDVNFSEAVIEKGEFKNCLLIGVNFEKADLVSVDFNSCAMQKVNLSHVRIEGVGIKESNLANACLKSTEMEFSNANIFRDVNLNGADLSGTKIGWFYGEKINLTNANLQDSSITESQLKDCILLDASLVNTELYSVAFVDCEMQKSVLAASRLNNVTFKESVLENADFAQTEIGYSSFLDSRLDGADFSEAAFQSSNEFKNVSMAGADFSAAVFSEEAQMENVDLRGAKGLETAGLLRFAAAKEAQREPVLQQDKNEAAVEEYLRQVTLFTARYMGSEVNAEVDERIAQTMLQQGYEEELIASVIAAHSPQALKRIGQIERYALGVVRKAVRKK